VNDIIQGRNIQSEIAYRETAGDLNRQQAASLREQLPHVAAKMLAEIDQSKEAAGASRASRVSSETLLPVKVEQERAQTAQYRAQTRRVDELLEYEKRNITANIEQSLEAAGASRANAQETLALYPKRAALLDKQNAEYVDLITKGQRFSAKGMDLVKERNDNIQLMAKLEKERQEKISAARKDEQSSLKLSTDAEQNLTNKRPGGYAIINAENELAPDADMFHATSKKPYVYILESKPGTVYGSSPRMNKRDLPKVDGHQYTAQEVYDSAAARSMTVQQYMEQVFYPWMQVPVPWNTAVTSTLDKPQ
jgi:hypothetical protein